MRITYITNSRIPTEKAHGIQIMKTCGALAEFSDVELVLPKRFNWIKEGPFGYYGMDKSFKIIKLPCFDLIRFHKYLGHFGLWLESLTFFLSAFFYLFFRKHNFVIYTRDRFLLPFVFFSQNLIFEAHSFPNNYFLYSFFLKRLRGIVVITEKLKERFAAQGITESKILVAPDGVDFEKFQILDSKYQIREKLGLPQGKKIVLYAGHLYGWKGAQTLADASQYLPEDAEVYLVGGTREDINQYKIQNTKYPDFIEDPRRGRDRIQIIGHRPYAEIPYWLKAADVLVLPNSGKAEISKYWTSPMKLFEYMAAGRPIVASDLPSIREILNEENAVLVSPDSPERLAQAIKSVLQNPEFSAKISAKAVDDARKFTWHNRAKNIYEYYFTKKDKE